MFDFDETLAITEEVTLVREKKSNRIVDHLHGQAQFDEHELNEKKYYYDFSEFISVSTHAKPINATLDLMRDFLLDKKEIKEILTVNGEELDNVLDINKYFFLRNVSNVTVKRQNGSTTRLTIPDDIGSKMFESGEMIPFSPVIPAILDSIIPGSPASNIGLKSNDEILNICNAFAIFAITLSLKLNSFIFYL